MPARTGRAPGVTWKLSSYNDLIVAALIIGIVLIIIIPMPAWLLSILLVGNFTVSMVIILTTMFITQPLQLSVFPTLLLVVTLFRLSLNISSTRLILGTGDAGEVISAFGEFVVSGNYVVGFIIFAIITIVQFVVITNGAGRVAEVAARFTLDAMPGKQMSIDADLNSGLITENEARDRRKQLQREADFFGAMDGASKFVRGDAIAGLVIILINVAGGFVIGTWQMGLPMMDSLRKFTLLTIGDGLISQLPALLVSSGTGILVTRASAGESLGKDLSRQLSGFPRVIALTAVILAVLGLVPGLPHFPFLILAAGVGYAAYTLLKEEGKAKERQRAQAGQQARPRQPENVLSLLQVDPLEIEIGYNLIPLTDEAQGGDLLERLAAIRRQCAAELGIFVRPIRIRDNLQLAPNAYCFKIRGVETVAGELKPGHFLAMNPGENEEAVMGIATKEPTFGLPAWWVIASEKERLELKGFTVVDGITVLITHLTEFIKSNASELLGRQEVKEMVDTIKEQNPAVVEELIPDLLSIGEIQKVLQNLLKERVPVRDLVTILEALADNARLTKDLDYLTESTRQALKRTISRLYASEDNKLAVITLHPRLEQAIADSLQTTQSGNYPVLAPEAAQRIFDQMASHVEKLTLMGRQAAVLCSSRVRLPFKRLTERVFPGLAVLALNELAPQLEIESVGTVMPE